MRPKTLASARPRQGFTLIDLVISIAILAILLTIAVPTYNSFVKKSRRPDGTASLLSIQLEQEKWRGYHAEYGTASELEIPSTSAAGFYLISISNVSASGYLATATPTGPQSDDICGTFAVNQDGQFHGSGYAAADCW